MAKAISAVTGGNMHVSGEQLEGGDFSEILSTASKKEKNKRGGEDGLTGGGGIYLLPFMVTPPVALPGGGFRFSGHGRSSVSPDSSLNASRFDFRKVSLSDLWEGDVMATRSGAITMGRADRSRAVGGEILHRKADVVPAGFHHSEGGESDVAGLLAVAESKADGVPTGFHHSEGGESDVAGLLAVAEKAAGTDARVRELEKGATDRVTGPVNAVLSRPVGDGQTETHARVSSQVYKRGIPVARREVEPAGRNDRQFTLSYSFCSWSGHHGATVKPVAGGWEVLPSGPVPAEALAQQLNIFPLDAPRIIDPDAGQGERERRQQQGQDEDAS